MRETIFGSKAEQTAYKRLTSVWSKYLEIYPQIPVRQVLGYNKLQQLPLAPKTIDYLLKTEFDFVVCEKRSSAPLLAIEFDGIGHGFSRDGEYISRVVPINDPYRKLKLDSKLQACELSGVPLIVVSFPETELLEESGSAITVLDAIISEVQSSIGLQQLISSHRDAFTEAFNEDPTGEGAEQLLLELEVQSDLKNNPIRRRTREMFRKLPISGDYMAFLRDREGYIGIRRAICGGIQVSKKCSKHQILLSTSVYVRDLNCPSCESVNLADCVAEYCLARKALREIGTARSVWRKLLDETPWTEDEVGGA
jgi:hypothetical protein